MLTEEDTLASSLNFRLEELATQNGSAAGTAQRVSQSRRLLAFLPLSILATLAVIVLPVAAVAALVPARGILWELLAVLLVIAGSLAIASAGSWIWMRWPRSRDMLFAELMLWGWIRRFHVERRLARTRDLFESARASGSPVGIELLTRLSEQLHEVDPYLHGHGRRVSSYAGRIARELHLPASEIGKIEAAAHVHDVGKIYTPQEILHKPDRLTDREFAIVKLHPRDGAELLGDVGNTEIAAIVLHHHERLDGHGYPDGIGGEQIPIGARIIAVADTFDAITSTRPYRPPRSHKEAIDILSAESGKQLDARVVAAFLACYAARRPVIQSAFASVVPERLIAAFKGSTASFGAHSLTQTLPALGLAGALAASPVLGHAVAGTQHQATRSAARLSANPFPAPADRADADARSGPLALRGEPSAPAGPRGSGGSGGSDPSTNQPTGTGASQPPPGSPGGAQSPSPSGPQTPGPAPATPGSPPTATRPPSTTPTPTPTTPRTPTTPPAGAPTAPVTTPSNPPVKVTVPPVSTPVVTLPTATAEGVTTPSVTIPSITTPSVSAPGVTVPGVTVPGISVPGVTVTVPHVNVAGVEL